MSNKVNHLSSQGKYSVELVDLNKVYDTGYIKVHALKDINLKIRRGEFVAIMGPSGSGKSTLLNLLGALDRPTSGKVLIDGIDISRLSNDELARLRNEKIGFVFQSYNLINRSKIIRNVELPALIKGIPKKERVKKAIQLLEVLGLSNVQNRTPKTLSGGQQQRVAIARALINDPEIILADEPTGNLDSVSGKEVVGYLRRMNEKFGTTIILVTHDREMAEMVDRIVYLKDGRIIGEEIMRRSKDEKE
ncbi:MAG: ABC transporter ATP-binding protein [Candidatus Asgardarchaeia archaeon]